MSGDSDSDKEWLTVSEAAARLPVSSSTVRNLVRAGKLESIRLESGHRRIRATSVERYRRLLLESTTDHQAPAPDG